MIDAVRYRGPSRIAPTLDTAGERLTSWHWSIIPRWQCASGRPPFPSSQAGIGIATRITAHSQSVMSLS
jgi:hypothetical protein